MAENNNNDTTIIGADSHFKGELTFERAARVNGKFDGKISGKGELHVNENALAKADIDAGAVNVDGRIEGNVSARDTVRLNNKGMIKGDITAAKMIMSEGASFFGQCAVGPEAAKQAGGSASGGGASGGGASGGDGGRPGGTTPPSAPSGPQGGSGPGGAPPRK